MKEKGKLLMNWLPGKDDDEDLFSKNLDGPAYEQIDQVYVSVDVYVPDPLSRESVGS